MAETKILNNKLKKFYIILFSLIILLIPVAFLFGIINDRESYKNEAVSKIEKSWAKAQLLNAPEMQINIGNDKKNPQKILNLAQYDVSVNIKTGTRKKGIFKIPVYTASVILKGKFKNPYGYLNNTKSELSFNVTDSKGFIANPQFKIGDEDFNSVDNNVYVKYLTTRADSIPFEIRYNLRGLNMLSVEPAGTTSNISIYGDWANPSFEGEFLPAKHKITNKNFMAEWSIPKIATLKPDKKQDNAIYDILNDEVKVSVSLLTPVDNYRMATRAVKYAFLFILLTFVAYYVFEIASKKKEPIHPIQYLLIGGALLIFYLLLTSISEFLPFWTAYIISVLSTIGVISSYTYFVLTKKENMRFTILISLIMLLLYTFLYTLLVIQDLSLLIGSFILFFVIAIIMYATRNVDWYDEN